MKNASTFIFYTMTVLAVLASISVSVYLLYQERSLRSNQGQEVLQEFVHTWNGLAREIQLPDDETGYQNLFPRWIRDFISSYPAIHSLAVDDDAGNGMFIWTVHTDRVNEITYENLESSIQSLDDSPSWRIQMTYRVITSDVLLQIFRYIAYICIIYTLYLLISFLIQLFTAAGTSDLYGETDQYTETFTENEQVRETSTEPAENLNGSLTTIDRYLSESAMQETELSLMLLFLFDQDEMPSAQNWLIKRYTDSDRVISIESGNYAILLPGINVHAAVQEARTVLEYWPERGFAGISARNGRLLDGKTLLKEARAALDRARQNDETVVGFEPDPQKYRNYIASLTENKPK
ncbi:hypothetical protein [Spirochaeta dissipatitropha]